MPARDAIAAAGVVVATVVSLSGQAGRIDLRAYQDLLSRLDTKTPACLETAREALDAGFRGGQPEGEAAVRAFRAYYLARVAEWEPVLLQPGARLLTYDVWLPPAGHRLVEPLPIGRLRVADWPSVRTARQANPTLASRLDVLRRWPFAVSQVEGDWYLAPDADWLARAVRGVPCRLADFLAFLSAESRQVVAEDASLRVSWDDLRVRIARWAAFARANAGLPEVAAEVRPHMASLFRIYLCPLLDNSPEYDRGTQALVPALQASYRRFVTENRDVEGHAFVEGLLAQLTAERYQLTPAVVRYLTRPDSPAPCEIRGR
jgi:hypothetical protein